MEWLTPSSACSCKPLVSDKQRNELHVYQYTTQLHINPLIAFILFKQMQWITLLSKIIDSGTPYYTRFDVDLVDNTVSCF